MSEVLAITSKKLLDAANNYYDHIATCLCCQATQEELQEARDQVTYAENEYRKYNLPFN